ncbi:hypothetical protein OCHUTO_1070 [Orientia chuto str. Dubai]|uniref:Uncharacterized protein n=1 Tax=Orientia chuto str. Dubai TaxID=1359168 RepID=A0A0F3MG93_9RICK|nr:hypothetical protein OCHUTO_1070 [Orientia chuto str. Dubai]
MIFSISSYNKKYKKKNPDFENHDYYVLHVIPLVDAIDRIKLCKINMKNGGNKKFNL